MCDYKIYTGRVFSNSKKTSRPCQIMEIDNFKVIYRFIGDMAVLDYVATQKPSRFVEERSYIATDKEIQDARIFITLKTNGEIPDDIKYMFFGEMGNRFKKNKHRYKSTVDEIKTAIGFGYKITPQDILGFAEYMNQEALIFLGSDFVVTKKETMDEVIEIINSEGRKEEGVTVDLGCFDCFEYLEKEEGERYKIKFKGDVFVITRSHSCGSEYISIYIFLPNNKSVIVAEGVSDEGCYGLIEAYWDRYL